MAKTDSITARLSIEINSGAWPPNGVIPTVAELSRQENIAPNTANRVLQLLHFSGYLERSKGEKKYRLARSEAPLRLHESDNLFSAKSHLDHPSRKSSKIALMLRSEILTGNFDEGLAFPRPNEIQSRFRISSQTAMGALQLLEQWGLLEKTGKSFQIKKKSNPGGTRIIITGRSSITRHMPYERFLDGIEKHLMRIGWPPPVYCYITSDTQPMLSLPEEATAFIAVDDAGQALIRKSVNNTIPKIVLNPGGSGRYGNTEKNSILISPDHEHAGLEVARFLAQQDHFNIAFFSHMDLFEPWLKTRLDGIRNIYSDTDKKKRVLRIYAQSPELFPGNRDLYQKNLYSEMGKFAGTKDWHHYFPPNLFHKFFTHNGYNIAGIIRLSKALRPVFKKALLKKETTAWICVNDEMAIAAHTFLQNINSEKKDLPNVTLISFDNNPMTQLPGISSFDFRYDIMGRLAVECIARPQVVFGRLARKKLLVPGSLVVRSNPESIST